jgi:hypothetical protein
MRQHFFLFLCVVAPRVYSMQEILASFFFSFHERFVWGNPTSPEGKFQLDEMSRALSTGSEGNNPVTIP